VSRDKSVRRSAQDDDFVGIVTKNILNKLALMGTQSWVKIRETKSPVGTTESYPEAVSEYLPLEYTWRLRIPDPLSEFRTMSR
jgi:hypothetical protein